MEGEIWLSSFFSTAIRAPGQLSCLPRESEILLVVTIPEKLSFRQALFAAQVFPAKCQQ